MFISDKPFEELGIPAGYGFKQSVFSAVGNTLVVQMHSAGNGWRPERLYFRRLSSGKYRNIGEPGDLTSQEFPFVHSSKPLLCYNSMRHRFTLGAQGEEQHSGDWDSLKIFDLERGVEINSIDEYNLRLPTGMVTGWISRIVALGDSGLFVQAGLSKDSTQMDYVIAEIDLVRRSLMPIATLPATFI
jgi:hypothetical protein